MSAPAKILELVKRFEDNADDYRAPQYGETQTRIEFINPFFERLGWDIHNRRGASERFKDVIHEAALKIGGATKAPNYCFRLGGTAIFYLEAKKPFVNISSDPAPAFQLRRYAWTAQLPLSILTNFQEFAVYDCNRKPALSEQASFARIHHWTYQQYPDKWDEIAGIFSKEAVEKGSIERPRKPPKGTQPVDAAFLEEIESWRELLAKNIALRNPKLKSRDLNYAVQMTIDRIIFLRMCEDQGIETYQQLQVLLNGTAVYGRLKELFRQADDRYNSGLFHFHPGKDRAEPPDELTPALKIDDKPLKEILRGLYYPDSPYDFRVLPVEILGQVYEQFLGKVIRLTAGGQAKVEDKPEVKKAGGVYYTPKYIVDYIVKNTVGKLLEGKTPKHAEKLRILDPACGSGCFLLGASQYLLDWHRDWYVADGPEKHTKDIYQGPGATWRLTTTEKNRILLKNIYGVDIDPQAVEVTKLSLLLKVLEAESKETLERQLRMWHERALPDLASNIKCGNSLIGPDFYNGQQLMMFDEEERYRINAFDWNAEFRDIVEAGGFHAVIGNPPWGQKAIEEAEAVKRYVWDAYPSSRGIFDLFRPFVERGIRLLANGGRFGMVLPDIVLLKDYPDTRRFLLEQLSLERIDWWGMAFAAAVIDAATIIGSRKPVEASNRICATVHDADAPLSQSIPQLDFWGNPRFIFNLHLTPKKKQVLEQFENGPVLGDYFEIHEGVHSGNVREELFVSSRLDNSCRELYFGRGEIVPYHLKWDGRYIRLSALPDARTRKRYANLGKPQWHACEKLLVRRTGDYVLAAVDRHRRYASNNFFLVFPKQECWLDLDGMCALLNSPFMTWYFRAIEPRRGRVFAELKIKHLTTFPLPQPQTACQDLNQLGARRAAIAAEIARVSAATDLPVLERTANYLDSQIECLVRELLALPNDLGQELENIGLGGPDPLQVA